MSNNFLITQGSGTTIGADEVVDGTLGTVKTQFIKLMDGTLTSTNKLIISASGAAKVDGSSVTQPVSGTIAATQSGVWTVQPGNTANTTPWLQEIRSTTLASYSAVGLNITPAALATDIFTLTGSATKTVKVVRVIVSGIQTTAGSVSIVLVKRSTANSAGTSAALTVVPHDSANAAATATGLSYTANPTLGTLVGNMVSKKVAFEAAATASDFQGWDFSFDERVQPCVLRGTTQVFAVNLNGVTVTGGSLTCTIIWTEE